MLIIWFLMGFVGMILFIPSHSRITNEPVTNGSVLASCILIPFGIIGLAVGIIIAIFYIAEEFNFGPLRNWLDTPIFKRKG